LGGYVKIKPAKWYYAQAGLFLAIPNANNTANHGLDFQGARPPDQNGLYFIAETGVTPQIGRSPLPGKYVLGGYYWGLENTSFFGQPFDGKFWLLLASGSDALTRAFTRSCGRERWRY
jgi:porin